MPPWATFLLSAAVIILAGTRLSRDGDTIAERSGLGGAWIGAILVAGATSLPELATDIFAVRGGRPSLAVGGLFGACMANMMVLAVADMSVRQIPVLSRVHLNQVILGVMGMVMLALAAAGIVSPVPLTILGFSWATIVIAGTYILGMRLLHVNRERGETPFESPEEAAAHRAHLPPLRTAVIGFSLAAAVILVAAHFLASSAGNLADQLGLSGGFAGMVLLAVVTTLPESTVAIAAVRAGAYDLAVGNVLGSCCFNMAILPVLDYFHGRQSLLASVEPGLAIGALFAILLNGQAVLGILNKPERRVWYLEPDAVFLIATYGFGLYLVHRAGGM